MVRKAGQVFRSNESPVDSLSKRLSTSAVLKELSTPEGAGRGATHQIQRKSIAKRRLSGWSKLRCTHDLTSDTIRPAAGEELQSTSTSM